MPETTPLATYLLSLDDESFFTVYRNYLGPVQTPYHKHDLIQALHDFLVRPETQDRIVRLLTLDDRVVLSAVHVLSSPKEDELLRFLSGEFDATQMQTLISNLKDRLLLVDGVSPDRLQINPLLRSLLVSSGIGIAYLVRGQELPSGRSREARQAPWLQPPLLAAAYAFFKEYPTLFTRGGTLRKRTAQGYRDRFGTIAGEIDDASVLRTVLHVGETLELVSYDAEKDTIELRSESWQSLAELPERWVLGLIWASTLTSTVERSFEYAEILFSVIEAVPTDRSFSTGEFVRIFQLSGNGLSLPIDRDTVDRLARVGILHSVGEEQFALNPRAVEMLTAKPLAGTTRVHANLEVSVPPGTSFSETLTIASLASLGRYDTVPTYTLTEESIAEARRNGIENPLSTLQTVVPELPQNVRFLLKRWESRSRAVRLLQGIIVTAEEEETSILRNAPEFLSIVQEEIAPGVFLIRSRDTNAVEQILSHLEIGADPTVETSTTVDVDIPEFRRFLIRYQQPQLGTAPYLDSIFSGDGGTGEADPKLEHNEADLMKEELLSHLHQLDLSEDARQELSLRIQRGLVLFPDQIRSEIVPQFGVEVRGLDYLGKIRMIEQAISNRDILEVITRSGANTPQRVLVRPRSIVESGDDLMLRAIQIPEERAIKIRIRRISLLRRLSGTLISRNRTHR